MISAMLMGTVGIVMTAAMALMPIMLQSLMNYPVLDAGMLLATRGLGVMIMTGIFRSSNTIALEPRLWMTVGAFYDSGELWLMTRWNLMSVLPRWRSMEFCKGAGIGMLFVPSR